MKFIKKLLLLLLLLAAVFSVVYLFLPDISKYLDLSDRDRRLSQRIEEEEKKNIYYKKEINDLENNPVYIEKIAREKMGLSRPEEIIYKFNKNGTPSEEPVKAKKQGANSK